MMQILKQQIDLDGFWKQLAVANHALLLLDFDGTLSPFVADRDQARLYPGVRNELLSLLDQDPQQLRIVSGREIDDLMKRLGLENPPELWGCHGWQRQFRDGRRQMFPLPEDTERALREALARAESAGWKEQLERKPVSLALHWRGLPEREQLWMQRQAADIWKKPAQEGGLLLVPFDGGVELRCPGVTKGTVVNRMLQEVSQDAIIAYLGDDMTDEDAFVALGNKGLKVLVRSELRATAADLWLRPPDELLQFLRKWQNIREEGM